MAISLHTTQILASALCSSDAANELIAALNAAGGGTGTVTSVSVVSANGVSGTVATATTTPALTLSLGAITPASVAAVGTVTGSNLSGTNTGDQNLSGYALTSSLGSAAFVATTTFDPAGAAAAITKTSIGLGNVENTALSTWAGSANITTLGTIATGTVPVARISGLGSLATQSGTFSGTSSGSNTGDQTITLTGPVTGSGTGTFATTISAGVVTNAMLAGSITFANMVGSDIALAASQITSGTLALARLGSGTPAAGKYVDGAAGAWTALPAAGVTGSGASGEIAYWSGTSAVTGSAGLTYDGSNIVAITSSNAETRIAQDSTHYSRWTRTATANTASLLNKVSRPAVADTSISLNGTSDYGTFASALIPSGSFTASLWLKPTAISGTQVPLAQGSNHQFLIILNSNGSVTGRIDTANSTATSTFLSAGVWAHVAMTVSGTAVTVWINGVSSATSTQTANYDGSTPLLGCYSSSALFYGGKIEDLRVYGTALSSGDITTLAAGGDPASTPLHHYTFDEGTGSTFGDSVGSNNGTIVTGSWSTDIPSQRPAAPAPTLVESQGLKSRDGTVGGESGIWTLGDPGGRVELSFGTELDLVLLSGTQQLVDSAGNISLGGGLLATSATSGFAYLTTCAGTPTGIPTTKTGMVAVQIDSTNHIPYFNDGSWRGLALLVAPTFTGQVLVKAPSVAVSPLAVRAIASQTAPLFPLQGISSTSTPRDVAYLDAGFTVPTDASRTGFIRLCAQDYTGTLKEGVRVSTDGTKAINTITGQMIAGGSSPTFTAGTGAGTGGTTTGSVGNDIRGLIVINTGTLPTLSATAVTVAFSSAYPATPVTVLITPANSNAAALSGLTMVFADTANVSTTQFTLTAGATALSVSTTYAWYYHVFG